MLVAVCFSRVGDPDPGKSCKRCGEWKVLDNFCYSAQSPGRYSYCRECVARRLSAKYHSKSSDSKLADGLRKFGITVEDYYRMLKSQGNRCAVCKTDNPRGRGGRWCVDHCHSTGEVRGLLCGKCNVGIGMFRDSPALLSSAIEYLSK